VEEGARCDLRVSRDALDRRGVEAVAGEQLCGCILDATSRLPLLLLA